MFGVWGLECGVWGVGFWRLGVWGLGVWAFGRLGVWAFGRFGVRAIGRLGVWAFGRLGVWAFGRLGVWSFGRLGVWVFGVWGWEMGHPFTKLEASLEFGFAALSFLPSDGPGVSAVLGEGCVGLLFGIGCGMREKGNFLSSSFPKPKLIGGNLSIGCRMFCDTMAKQNPESRRKTNERT